MTDYSNLIKEKNPDNIPMIETDFYKFMVSGGYDDSSLYCKTNYLKSLGFIKGVDKVSHEVLVMLGYIVTEYFSVIIKPTIKPVTFYTD